MKLNDERGMMAIGGAVMLIVVLPLLATALWQYGMLEIRQVARREKELQALYLARAGAEAAMSAWLSKPVNERPQGSFDRVYYDTASETFVLYEPTDALGYFDVEIREINDPEDEKYRLTEIVSTAVVGGVSRAVTVTTYPFLFGHEEPLKWYNPTNGRLQTSTTPGVGLVRVKPEKPLHFEKEVSPPYTSISSDVLVFEESLDLSHEQTTGYKRIPEHTVYSRTLPIKAETIFFDDVILLEAPTRYDLDEIRYSVTLEVPEGKGIPGSEIPVPGGKPGEMYGRVFFDGDRVRVQRYRWGRTWFLFYLYRFESDSNRFTELRHPDGNLLAGRAFYFRSGINLMDFQDPTKVRSDDLIPLGEESIRFDVFRDIRPFIWE